jgi:hypothetical protein
MRQNCMSNVILHPRFYPRLTSAVDNVIASIRRSGIEERLAELGSEWNDLIVSTVAQELREPCSGLGTMLKQLRRTT